MGYSYNTEYSQIGDNFIQNIRKLAQGQISGELVFKSYNNYRSFINFVESANSLKFVYIIALENGTTEYFKDVDIASIEKGQKGLNGLLICPVIFTIKSLWYEQKEVVYNITTQEDEVRWNFRFNSRFVSYNNRKIIFQNQGHTNAPFLVEMDGYLLNPSILIEINGEEVYELTFDLTLQAGEKLFYCTRDTDLFVYKQSSDGTITNLFDSLDLNKINFFKIPKRNKRN